MKRELDWLIYRYKNTHINDFAGTILINIIETVFLSSRNDAFEYLKEIDDKEDMWIISNHFGRFSGKYQDKEFIDLIKGVVKKFENKVEYLYFEKYIDCVNEAINAMDSDEQIEWDKYVEQILQKNTTQIIDIIEASNNEKLLKIVFAYSPELTTRFQSQKLIDVFEKNFFKINDESEVRFLKLQLIDAKNILSLR